MSIAYNLSNIVGPTKNKNSSRHRLQDHRTKQSPRATLVNFCYISRSDRDSESYEMQEHRKGSIVETTATTKINKTKLKSVEIVALAMVSNLRPVRLQ